MTPAALLVLFSLAAEPVPLASVGIQAAPAQGELADLLGNTLALRMTETGLVKVTTPADIAIVLGVARQKQLLGCEETSCIAELAGALGARAIVTGQVAKAGEVFQLSVKVLDAASSATLFSALERHQDAASLLSAVDRLGAAAALDVGRRYGLLQTRLNLAPVIGLGLGAGLAAAAGVLLAMAGADHAALLAQAPVTFADAVALQQRGVTRQGVGLGLLVGGGAVLLGSAVWLLISPRSETRIAFAPGPGGVMAWGRF